MSTDNDVGQTHLLHLVEYLTIGAVDADGCQLASSHEAIRSGCVHGIQVGNIAKTPIAMGRCSWARGAKSHSTSK